MGGGSWSERLGQTARGQSSTLGFALLFGITMLGVGSVVVFGSVALNDTQQVSDVERVEQAMSQFDSDTAEVALGDSDVKTIDFGHSDGSYNVESGGTITITHVDWDGSGGNEQLYHGQLGSVVYRNEKTTIAYQAGGVWRVDDNGRARMVSPPEFHYRDGTLTLPVVKTQGSGSVSGQVKATVERTATPFVQAYPDASTNYDGGAGPAYLNPVAKGHIEIEVESRYAAAWKEYFESRTEGTTTYDDGGTPNDPSDDSVTLSLETLGQQGPFGMPRDDHVGGGNPLRVRGMESGSHSLTDFSFTLYSDEGSNSQFKNLKWGMHASNGDQHIEVAVNKPGGSGSYSCGDRVPITIYYTDDDHDTYQGWQMETSDGFVVQCVDYDGDGTDEAKVTLDLTAPSKDITYKQLDGSQVNEFKSDIEKNDIEAGLVLDQHAADPGAGTTFTDGSGDTAPLALVVRHYFALMAPNYNLKVDDRNAAGVNEGASNGVIYYTGGDNVVTYLHVSENRIDVDIRAR